MKDSAFKEIGKKLKYLQNTLIKKIVLEINTKHFNDWIIKIENGILES